MAVAAQDRGFFADLIIPVDGITHDHFPRRDTSLEKLAKLSPHSTEPVDAAHSPPATAQSQFYTEWKGRFGDEPWALLESFSGKLV